MVLTFQTEDDRDHIGMPKMFANDTEAMPVSIRDAYRKELDEIFKQCKIPANGKRYTELKNDLKSLGYTSSRKIEKIIGDGLTEKLIKQESNSRYYYIGIKTTDNEMPFAPTEEKVPF